MKSGVEKRCLEVLSKLITEPLRLSALLAKMDCPHLGLSTWCGTAWVSLPVAVGSLQSMQIWHCGTDPVDYAVPSPVCKQEIKNKGYNEPIKLYCWYVGAAVGRRKTADLVLFQEFKFDCHTVPHPLILLAVNLEHLLALLDLRQSGGVAWSQIQLLQICAIRIILNPGDKTVRFYSIVIMCEKATRWKNTTAGQQETTWW